MSRVGAHQVELNRIEVGEQTAAVGDEIVTLRNDRRLVFNNDHWVRNGGRWRIERRTMRGAGPWLKFRAVLKVGPLKV